MVFCTVVEWDQDITETLRSLPGSESQPDGILVRIVGASDKATYVIEVWNSGDDARRVAEQSPSNLGQVSLPHRHGSTDSRRPSRISAPRTQAEPRCAASSPSTLLAMSSFRRGALKHSRRWE